MKTPSVIVAAIVGVSLIVSVAILSSAIKEYGRSVERAAANQLRSPAMPTHFTLSVEGGSRPLRFDVNGKVLTQ